MFGSGVDDCARGLGKPGCYCGTEDDRGAWGDGCVVPLHDVKALLAFMWMMKPAGPGRGQCHTGADDFSSCTYDCANHGSRVGSIDVSAMLRSHDTMPGRTSRRDWS